MSVEEPLITGETRAKARRSLLRSAVVVVVMVIAYAVIPLREDGWWIGAALGLAAIIGIAPLTVRRIHAVRRSEEPVLVAVEALVLLVTLLVLGFSAVYYAIDANQTQFEGLGSRLDAVYFTVVTLGTVGYGDVHPIGDAARTIVILQILANLAFLGVVVRILARVAGVPR
jgi:hypothetical protein